MPVTSTVAFAKHRLQTTEPQIDWDSSSLNALATLPINYYQRFALESWFSNLEQTPLNRGPQLRIPARNFSTFSTTFRRHQQRTNRLVLLLKDGSTLDPGMRQHGSPGQATNYITISLTYQIND